MHPLPLSESARPPMPLPLSSTCCSSQTPPASRTQTLATPSSTDPAQPEPNSARVPVDPAAPHPHNPGPCTPADASLIAPARSMGSPGSANGRRGEYVRIPEDVEVAEKGECGAATAANKAAAAAECPRVLWWRAIRWWAKVAVLGIFLAGGAAAAVVFLGPLVIKKVVTPILQWQSTTFSRPAVALICFGAIALFPSVLLPSSPFMWLAGMTFGYLYGFLIITAGMSIGMSLPYFIGSAFHCKIHRWLEKWPKKAAFVRLAGEGDWHHQFRAVALLRISPFPYIVFNYASVATNVKYCPYIAGSMTGTIHETFLAIYSGKLLQSLAVATSKGSFLSVDQIIYNGIGFTVAAASTAAITIYAKKALQKLQAEDEIF